MSFLVSLPALCPAGGPYSAQGHWVSEGRTGASLPELAWPYTKDSGPSENWDPHPPNSIISSVSGAGGNGQ